MDGLSDLKGVFQPRWWHDSMMAAWWRPVGHASPVAGPGEEVTCCSSRHSKMLRAPEQGLWEKLSMCSPPGRHRDWPRSTNVMKTFHGTSTELQSPSPEEWRFKEPWLSPIGFGLTMIFLLGFDYIPHLKRLLKECFFPFIFLSTLHFPHLHTTW